MTDAATITHTTDGSRRIPIDSSPSSAATASTTALPIDAGRERHPAATTTDATRGDQNEPEVPPGRRVTVVTHERQVGHT
jgi:hypothetical protein